MSKLIIRSKEPEVLEFPFEQLASRTPNDLFYVRSHFPNPELNERSFTLTVDGSVSKTLSLSHADIMKMPARTVGATLECAGNNRIYLVPTAPGVQWAQGGVSTADWTGVPLKTVLEAAGLSSDVVDIVFEGADKGEPGDPQKPSGPINFARSLPVAKAMHEDVLLAYAMNGETLTPSHGYPLRLIVPGWFAVASVKWLTRITAISQRFLGFYQGFDYGYWERRNGQPVRVPITEMMVKAQIAKPQASDQVKAGSQCTISGAAWSGEAKVSKVEVSTDGGASWSLAKFEEPPEHGVWCLWNFTWNTPAQDCECTLLARATDEKGNTQQMKHDLDRSAYLINFCVPIKVRVRK